MSVVFTTGKQSSTTCRSSLNQSRPFRCVAKKAEFGLSLHGLDTWKMADIQTDAIAWAAPERAQNTSLSSLDLLRYNVFMVSRDDSMKRNDRDGIYHQDSRWDNYSITCSIASHAAGMLESPRTGR